MERVIDIHCHPTLHQFAFHNVGKNRKNDLWWENPPNDRQRNNQFPEYFQSNMPALTGGNVKIAVVGLYPIEQNWFDPVVIGTGDLTDFLAKYFTVHLPIKYVNKVQAGSYNYFDFLQKEFEFLKDDIGTQKSSLQGWKYMLPASAEDIKGALDKDKTIIIIPSIEGAHSLISGNNSDIINGKLNINKIIKNIETVKSWIARPMYVTVAHHFYNGLCGHANSIPLKSAKLIPQRIGLNMPINELGMEVIDALLGINKYQHHSKRILIDTKHMSIAARMQYHEKIKQYNIDKSDEDCIPIVSSHSGYGGHKTMSDSILIPDDVHNKYENSSEYNPWSINLSNEEIIDIYKSKGIIGLNLDQRILCGQDRLEDEQDRFSNKDIRNNTSEVKRFWSERIASNILGIIGAIVDSDELNDNEKQNAWDILSLGSDFDGMINPVDSFITSDEFQDLRDCLIKYLPGMNDFSRLSMNIPTDVLIDRIMYGNALKFILRNY